MLNYIWAGLILFSLVFASWSDISDLRHDTFRNGQHLAVSIKFKPGADPSARQNDVQVVIDPAIYREHFEIDASPAASYAGTLVRTGSSAQLRFGKDASVPKPLVTMRDTTDDKELRPTVTDIGEITDNTAPARLLFEKVRFVKMRAISAAAFAFAKEAVTIAIGLIGVLSLWLGLMSIAEASGLIAVFVKLVEPVLQFIFPQIPKGHPALGFIALNMAANMLGLGNAATPMGLKAMEEMQKLNPSDDTATDPMVMMLAINTAGVQLVPPASLVAILGIGVGELYFPIIGVTFVALIISMVSCMILARLPMYRRTNPNLVVAEGK